MVDNSAEFWAGKLCLSSIVPGWVDLGQDSLLASIGAFAAGMYPEQLMSWRRLHDIARRSISASARRSMTVLHLSGQHTRLEEQGNFHGEIETDGWMDG